MKKLLRFLSYLIAILFGSAITLAAIQHFSLPTSKLDQLEYLIRSRFIGEYDKKKTEDLASAAMIASLGDRWSYYIPAEEFASHMEQVENAYVGIGITISPSEDGSGFDIIAVQENGSAFAAGLLVGDKIVAANDQRTEGMTTEDLRNIVRGKEGTIVTLGILRNGEELTFEIPRAQILTEVVKSQMLDSSIGLIRIANFDSRCASETIAAIEALQQQGAEALIFDVRNNPGGYANELVQLLDYLLPEGVLFRTIDYAGNESVDHSDSAFLDMPMAVLCNEDSYSAAEFFAAAIQEYGAGTIVGAPTCGKGYFQYTFPLADGSAVGLSVGKYFTPKGNSLTDVGIQPDITVEIDNETYFAIYYGTLAPEEDPQIQAAVKILLP